MNRLLLHAQPLQIHAEQLFALMVVRPVEFFASRCAPNNGGIQHHRSISTRKNENAPIVPPEIIDFLNDGVDRDLVLVVALGGVPRRGQRVCLINNEEGLARLACLLGNNLESFIEQRAHLSDFAGAAHACAELEEHRFLLTFSRQAVARALGCGGLSSAHIAGKDHERVSLRYRRADRQLFVMKLLAPIQKFLRIGKQPQIAVQPLVARLKPTSLFVAAAFCRSGVLAPIQTTRLFQ